MQQQQAYTAPTHNYTTTQTTTTTPKTQYTHSPISTTTNYEYTNILPNNITNQYNIAQANTSQIANEFKTPTTQIQEYQTTENTQNPQIIQNQGITQQAMPQVQQYQYGAIQNIQQPGITKTTQTIQQQNIPEVFQQNPSNQIIQAQIQQPIAHQIPLPPVNYDNPHFIKDFPIYESDPRYLAKFGNRRIYTQVNNPVQNVTVVGTNQVAPVAQNLTTVVNQVPQIKPGVTILNNPTPVINQIGTGANTLNNVKNGITGLNNINTGFNQINNTVNAPNNVTTAINQKEQV